MPTNAAELEFVDKLFQTPITQSQLEMLSRCGVVLSLFRGLSSPSTAPVHLLRKRNWRLGGIPAPPPIRAEPSVDLSEELPEVDRPIHGRVPRNRRTPEYYAKYRAVIKKNFPEGWSPPRKLSREAMDGLRELHRFNPEMFSTPVLAEKFRISPEAVRRILKSKWEPSRERRMQLAEKRRKQWQQVLARNRLEEMMKQVEIRVKMKNELERLNKMSAERSDDVFPADDQRPNRGHTDVGRKPRGVNSNDKLFFT